MPCFETFVSLKRKIGLSNYDSAHLNGNLYIAQEQASIEEIYEQYPCS